MKLIKNTTLYFKDEKSDKVYEVDLLDYGSDLFLVNFRYGRRESELREGTKTVFPVDFIEAEKIYDSLVKSKIKKGYSENENSPSISKELKIGEPINSKRTETILLYLDQAQRGVYDRNWKVSRIIQRAGQLNITKSAMLIAPFVNSKDDFEQYAAINVLAQFNYN